MIKRVNFTGRKRVPLDRVHVEVFDGEPRRFDATIDLKDLNVPQHAIVVLEAMCAGNSTVLRFDFGTVAALVAPEKRLLADLNGENVFFTLKLIDRSERFGRILGIAENIRPLRGGNQTAVGRRGILPSERVELGQQLWKLDFKDQDVFLLVNKNVPGLADRAHSDPLFYAVVYPQLIRDILGRAIFDEEADINEESDRWPVLWMRFGQSIHPLRSRPPASSDDEAAREWVEEVVKGFCTTHSMKERFTTALANGNGTNS